MGFAGDYAETDTIGLVVTIIAVLAVLIAGKLQQRRQMTSPRERDFRNRLHHLSEAEAPPA